MCVMRAGPGVFNRIPRKFAEFAAYKKREAYLIGVFALLFGTVSTCAIAMARHLELSDALAACLRWQGTATTLALIALFFVTRK